MSKLGLARFHVETGPPALFERVRQVFAEPRALMHGTHYTERAHERAAPRSAIKYFASTEWELMTAEVRTDTGKFVKTAWRREIGGQMWWSVIGFHDAVQTIHPASDEKTGLGQDIVCDGPVWDLVDSVNRQLLDTGVPPGVTEVS